ncbi:MAG TPA: hypothetical protein PKW59_14915, partial [Thermotogota bacterium]|nr:hypothetical protein [Thermotogota bacterium]
MKRYRFTLVMVALLFLTIPLITGCFLTEKNVSFKANIETLVETVPIFNITQYRVNLLESDERIASFEVRTDVSLAYPNVFNAQETMAFWVDSSATRISLIA